MADVVGNLVEKVEKMIEEARSWADLPPELKMKIIQPLNYKERIQLRLVTYFDKQMIDGLYYQWRAISISNRSITMFKRHIFEEYTIQFRVKPMDSMLGSIAYLLNHSETDHLSLQPENPHLMTKEMATELSGRLQLNAIRATRFSSMAETHITVCILEKVSPNLQLIFLLGLDESHPVDFFSMKQVVSAGFVRIMQRIHGFGVHALIEEWIDINKDIGSKLRFRTHQSIFNQLAATFETRQISLSDNQLRIKMNKESTEIIIGVTAQNSYRIKVVAAGLEQAALDASLVFY